MTRSGFAPAKINMTLHVVGRRNDGYHELESLVAFANMGDDMSLDPGKPLALTVAGPFSEACGDNNLVLKAAQALLARLPGLKTGDFHLQKNLPVAAGLGGGSADAAATLRLLAGANALPADHPSLREAALAIGADVPVCLASKTALMRGVGEQIKPIVFPLLDAVLVNCGTPLTTRDVFSHFSPAPRQQTRMLEARPERFTDAIEWLKMGDNDLAPAARQLCPEITHVEKALGETQAALVRLTGSGATVFGLYPDKVAAHSAAANLQKNNPRWWVRAVRLGDNL